MSSHDRTAPESGPETGPETGPESGPETGPETVDAEPDALDESPETGGASRRVSLHLRRARASRALITDASYTPEQNRQSRERQYAVLQGLRIPFILGAFFAARSHLWVLASVLFVVSVPLPWIAVVRGNAQGEVRDSRVKNVYKPAAARQRMLAEQQRAALDAPGSTARNSPAIIDHDE